MLHLGYWGGVWDVVVSVLDIGGTYTCSVLDQRSRYFHVQPDLPVQAARRAPEQGRRCVRMSYLQVFCTYCDPVRLSIAHKGGRQRGLAPSSKYARELRLDFKELFGTNIFQDLYIIQGDSKTARKPEK